jgi:osmotically-inducible protein OsmY
MSSTQDFEASKLDILAEVATRMGESEELAHHPVSCEFSQGVLTLRGRVATHWLKQFARSLVERIDGVRAVDNQLEVVPWPVFAPSKR